MTRERDTTMEAQATAVGVTFAGELRLALADIRRAVGLIDGCEVAKGAGALLAALDALERAGGTVQAVMIELS
jgi:hypothetical protein